MFFVQLWSNIINVTIVCVAVGYTGCKSDLTTAYIILHLDNFYFNTITQRWKTVGYLCLSIVLLKQQIGYSPCLKQFCMCDTKEI